MKIKIEAASRLALHKEVLAAGEKWSRKVKTEEHPPEGLFQEGSAQAIADWAYKSHSNLRGAMSSLNFYINRAGENLSEARKKVIENAKKKVRKMYGE